MNNKYVANYIVDRIDLSTTQDLIRLLKMIIDTNESLLSEKNINELEEFTIKITINKGEPKWKRTY